MTDSTRIVASRRLKGLQQIFLALHGQLGQGVEHRPRRRGEVFL